MLRLTLLTLTAALVPALAAADISLGERIGIDEAAIAEALAALGYDLEEIEPEAEGLEVEVIRDGVEYELMLDPKTGTVLSVELDD